MTGPSSPNIITWHGERETLWYVLDPAAPEAEQPAVLRTFSSRSATREDVRRFLEHAANDRFVAEAHGGFGRRDPTMQVIEVSLWPVF